MNTAYQSAGALLGINRQLVVAAVIGCDGKTTFIETLAHEHRDMKVLITPTTKMRPIRRENAALCLTPQDCASHKAQKGIQCLGAFNETSGKLEALPPDLLESIIPQYDIVLLEADGSQGLPCKGWLPDEPVIPQYCTHTLGIVTMDALGKPADSNTVLRIPEFTALTGLQEGDTISAAALTSMVCATNGMFRNAHGKQSLFVNKAENNAAAAQEWLLNIKQAYPGRFACLAYGSALANKWREL